MSAVNTTIEDPYIRLYEHFADDAAFLWLLRSVAHNQPHYLPSELRELETRIDNCIDGLLTNLDQAWPLCDEALSFEEPGEVFTAAVVAFRSMELDKIKRAVDLGVSSGQTMPGLISALAWLPGELRQPWIQKFLHSKDLVHKQFAIAVLRELRQDPGDYLLALLRRDDCLAHQPLYCECLRLIGEIKRKDLVPVLNAAMESEDENTAFWARWSAVLLGNRHIVEELRKWVEEEGACQHAATALYFRTASREQARAVISKMSKNDVSTRTVIKACAAFGDPQVIPWLIKKMEVPEHARAAGEAFTHITGIFLEENKLDLDLPDIAGVTDNDFDSPDITLDEDENLSWPNLEKIKAIWQQHGKQFTSGQRHLLGKGIGAVHLQHVIREGFQRHRQAAALELALVEKDSALINVSVKLNM